MSKILSNCSQSEPLIKQCNQRSTKLGEDKRAILCSNLYQTLKQFLRSKEVKYLVLDFGQENLKKAYRYKSPSRSHQWTRGFLGLLRYVLKIQENPLEAGNLRRSFWYTRLTYIQFLNAKETLQMNFINRINFIGSLQIETLLEIIQVSFKDHKTCRLCLEVD